MEGVRRMPPLTALAWLPCMQIAVPRPGAFPISVLCTSTAQHRVVCFCSGDATQQCVFVGACYTTCFFHACTCVSRSRGDRRMSCGHFRCLYIIRAAVFAAAAPSCSVLYIYRRREVWECEGWVCDLESIDDPSIFRLIHSAAALSRMLPITYVCVCVRARACVCECMHMCVCVCMYMYI